MGSKYLFFLLIPALFICTSCTRERPQIDEFFNFSSEPQKEQKKIEEQSNQKQKNDKTATQSTDEVVETPPQKVTELEDKVEGETIIKRYNIGYLTFNVADFYAELIPLEKAADHTKYKFRLYSKTNGFVDYVFGWMSYTASELKVYKNKVVPVSFKNKATLKKKTREIVLNYDESGTKITHEEVTPPDNRWKRPAVESSLKVGTYDPLTIVIEARRVIMNAVKNDNFNDRGLYSFTLPLYDGRKRTDINFTLNEKKINGFYFLKFTMKPVSGYTNNELKDIAKGERIISIYIDPITFTPIHADGKSPLGSATAKFLQDCEFLIEDCVKQNTPNKK